MRRIIITTLIALTALGGVASADRYRGGHYRGDHYRDYPRQSYRGTHRRAYQPRRVRVVRQPIYVQRPVIRYRYYNYYQRPAVIVENYPAKAGYIWVAGNWQWNGYEWIWQPGHYRPDPAYDPYYGSGYPQPGYGPGYQQPAGYYDSYGNWIDTSSGYYNY